MTEELYGKNIISETRKGLVLPKTTLRNINIQSEAKPQVRATQKVAFDVNQKRYPVNFHIKTDGLTAIDTSSVELKTGNFEAGWFYIITNIVAYQDIAGTPQVKLNIKQRYSEEVLRITSATIGLAEDSIDWQGELFIDDSNELSALFENANPTAANKLHLVIHGYRVKK